MSEKKETKKVSKTVKRDEKVSKKTTTKKPEKVSKPKKSVKNVTKKVSKVEPVEKDGITLEEADSFYHVSLLAQAVCVIGILAISVMAIFENSFTIPIEVLVGITLLIMAYNNVKLFKRKGLTIIYIIFGVISLIIGILGYFGVTL